MEKIKLWFIYEPVTVKKRLSETTKTIIKLVKNLERTFKKEIFDLRSIDYSRFLTESKIKIKKDELPVIIINNKIGFTKKLPSVDKIKKKISRLVKNKK